jgi:poly(A) polymerase/tRNA nucleotidyltransferase (CCA-adding enzyme)
MADRIMRRLKFSNQDREHVIHLIRHHMFHYTDEWTDGAVRRLMRNVGVEHLDDLFRLRMADREGNGKKRGPSQSLERLKRRIAKVIEAENAITVRDLAVNGHDIMNEFSIPPSRLIGVILEHLLEIILDEPEKNDREGLLDLARKYLAERPS